MSLLGLVFTLSFFFIMRAHAESHTIKFVNKCGSGSPVLMYNGKNVLQGDQYTSNGPFSGIAYLQTGSCNTNGENCTLLEMTLINSACVGCGSSVDISLIPPHAYSVESSFAFYGGCDGSGQTCSNPNCEGQAFFVSTDNTVQRECQVDNVNLLISFCADASGLVGSGSSPPPPASSSPAASAVTPSVTASSTAPVHISSAAPSATGPYVPSSAPSAPSSAPSAPANASQPPPSLAKACPKRRRRGLRRRSAKPGH